MSAAPTVLGLAVAWALLAGAVAVATRLLWPRLAGQLQSLHPRDRATLAFGAATGPLWLPSLAMVLCVLPGVAGALTGAGDHCRQHLEHPHLCLLHASLPASAWLGIAALPLAGGALAAARLAAGHARALHREARWLARRRLRALAPDVTLIASDRPLALTHGLARPRIFVSEGLTRRLSPVQQEVVIAHERAHARSADPLRFAIAALGAVLHGPATRRSILATLSSACEQRCDEAAAERVGDRLLVASTLLRVERLMQQDAPAGTWLAPALLHSSLPARIEALLAERRPGPRARRTALALAVGGLGLASLPIHHGAEHALALLQRLAGVGA